MPNATSTTNTSICATLLPYTWNGNTYNTTGSYHVTLISAAGCDSIATLNLVVNSTSSSTTNSTVCSNQLPYNWNGIDYNVAGTYIYHTLNSVGCDSAATLNLVVNQTSSSSTSTTICSNQLPYNWNGTNYNVAGTYVYHTVNAVGCDSAATLNLTVNAISSSTTNVTRCSNQLPFTWNGTNYNAAGTYVFHTLNSVGCDSAATLNLTINNTSTSVTNVTRCSNQLPFAWNGANYNAGGSFTFTTVNAAGCDSVATLNLTVNNTSTSVTNVTRCSDQLPYTWNGTNYSSAGTYVYHTLNTAGCDSAATLNLAVNAVSSSTTNVTICSDQLPYTWNGINYSSAGTYVYHALNALACDSAATLNLAVNAITGSTTNVTRCSSQLPFNWNGTDYSAAGTYVYHTLNAAGCDSAATLLLTVQSVSSQTFNPVICTGQTYTLPWGTSVSTAGTYRDTLRYTTGCDSIRIVVNLSVQNATSLVTNASICQGENYTLPWGIVVNTPGAYRDTLRYTTGCDSIRRIVNLTVQTAALQNLNPVICQGGSYLLPWGVVVSMAGTYRDTLRYTTGCDSIRRTVNLQVTAAAVSFSSAIICSDETYTLPWGAVTNVAGVYTDTVRTIAGCDSLIRTVNLTVNPIPSVSISKSNDVNCTLSVSRLIAQGGVDYSWTPRSGLNNADIFNPIASPASTTWYKVRVTSDKGCTNEDSIEVKVIAGNPAEGYLVPNAFTPNGDGKNDCFGMQSWGAVTEFELSVFNRWGERVFYTKDPRQCWDGKYKGKEQPSSAFVYQVSANGLCGKIYRRGTVILIR
jgi:gliding motility-associated-like protein